MGSRNSSSTVRKPKAVQATWPEKDYLRLVLKDVGKNKVEVIKAVCDVFMLRLKDAKDLVDGAPVETPIGGSRDLLQAVGKILTDAGAQVEIAGEVDLFGGMTAEEQYVVDDMLARRAARKPAKPRAQENTVINLVDLVDTREARAAQKPAEPQGSERVHAVGYDHAWALAHAAWHLLGKMDDRRIEGAEAALYLIEEHAARMMEEGHQAEHVPEWRRLGAVADMARSALEGAVDDLDLWGPLKLAELLVRSCSDLADRADQATAA